MDDLAHLREKIEGAMRERALFPSETMMGIIIELIASDRQKLVDEVKKWQRLQCREGVRPPQTGCGSGTGG
jgi:hypothetical protein